MRNAHDQPAAAFSISSAKGWYQQQYPANGGKKTASTGTETKTDISQIIQPDWDAPEVYSRRGAEVLETPAASGDYLLGIKSDNGNSYDARNSHSRFVLLKKDGEIKAYVMTLIADSAYLNGDKSKLEQNSFNKRDENFSGLVIYHTPKGDFVSGWVYQNGTLLRKMSNRTPAQQQEAAAVRKKQTQAVKEQNVSECVTYDIYQTYCEWGGTPDNPYEVFHGCWDEYIGSQTVCNTSGGSTGGGTGGGGSTGGGGTTNPPPCKTPNPNINVSSTKSTGGLKTNFVQPPPPVDDGGFPDPADPAPCTPKPVIVKQPDFGLDKDCLNCRITDAKFLELIAYLQSLGYSVTQTFNTVVTINGVDYPGKMNEVYDANGNLVVSYFMPIKSSGPFDAGIHYSIGNKGADGNNNSSGPNISFPPAPIINTGGIITYTRSGTTGSSAPSNSEVYKDPATGISLKYSDVLNAFTNSPALAQIEAGEENINFPAQISTIIYSLQKTQEFLIEYEILSLNNPDWSGAKLAAVAFWNVFKGEVHFMLDVVGFVPVFGEVADLANGGIYFLEGDKISCAFSVASAVPVVGWVATGGKWVKTAVAAVPIARSAGKLAYRAIKVGKEVKLIKVAIVTFEHASIKTLKAIKPADATLTNLSAYLVNTFALRISPTSTTLKKAIDDIIKLGDQAGTKMEKLADDIFATGGFKKYNAKIGSNNGFDGVYIKGDLANPTEIIINEAKQINGVGAIKLNKASDGKAAQMSEVWIEQTIQQMRINSDPAIANLGNILFKNSSKITKTVSAVDKSTAEIVILKLMDYR